MQNKKLIVALVILGTIILFGIIWFFLLKKGGKKTVILKNPKPTIEIKQITFSPSLSPVSTSSASGTAILKIKGQEIVDRTKKYIEKLKTGPGKYTTSLNCFSKGRNTSGSCEPTGVESYIPGMLVSFYEELFGKDNSKETSDTADKLMSEMMAECDKNISYCEMMFFPLFGRYQKTKDPQYLKAMEKAGEEVFLKETISEENKENINTYSLRTKKLLMLYTATNETKYLDKAKERFTRLEKIASQDKTNYQIFKERDFSLRKYDCLTQWTVNYQFYQSTKEQKYLEDIVAFIEKIKLDKNYGLIDNISTAATCGETLLSLYKEIPNPRYLITAKFILSDAVRNFLDSDLSPKFNGDNGFLFDKYILPQKDQSNTKALTENVWVARLITRAAWDDEFPL